jgi:acyl transferase domain-containing protein
MSDSATDLDRLTSLRRAALALKHAQSQIEALERERSEPIAVVGVGCRFPGAEGPSAYWSLIERGGDAIREVPPERFDVDLFFDPDPAPGRMSTRWAGLLDHVDRFDAGFFGISAGEACAMDPQQRLALEVVWEALEHAAIAPDRLSGTATGVFVGASHSDYFCLLKGAPSRAGTGIELSIIANRISYLLNLRGPSFTVDTACSSSLLAVHLACHSLRTKECDVAIAGGVGVILRPELTIGFSQAGMMAPDGRCKTFDARANGYVRGEGCGFVVLKRRSDAISANDSILALIRGSATNQDGRSNGLTSPNGDAQKEVIRAALANANLSPHDIGYVETHGTGTSLGDAVEVGALKEVFGARSNGDRALVLGAVKTNIGHLEAAAGIAGLIKTVLCLHHQVFPPVVHFRSLNPTIAAEGAPFVIPMRAAPWPKDQHNRFAGVSGFSFGGANVHVVLEGVEAAAEPDGFGPPSAREGSSPDQGPVGPVAREVTAVLAISAKDRIALALVAKRLADHLAENEQLAVRDVCGVLSRGRAHFSHRAAFVVSSIAEAIDALRTLAQTIEASGGSLPRATTKPKIAFFFGDEQSAGVETAQELSEREPGFKSALDERLGAVDPDLRSSAEKMTVAFELALAEFLRTLGVEATFAFGRGVGAYAAGCYLGRPTVEEDRAPEDLLAALEADGFTLVVEIGAGDVLTSAAGARAGTRRMSIVALQKRGASSALMIARALRELYASGADIDWTKWASSAPSKKLHLPTYPFQRKAYWLGPDEIKRPTPEPG